MTTCSECGQEKPRHAKGMCKTCYMHRHYQEHREDRLHWQRRYDEAHRERKLAYHCLWQKQNPERVAASKRRYQGANPQKMVIKNTRRAAHKAGVANTATPENIEFERRIGEAVYGPSEKLHLHHPIPFSKGGNHSWGNIMFIPAWLNISIGDKLPQEVYRQLSFYGEGDK